MAPPGYFIGFVNNPPPQPQEPGYHPGDEPFAPDDVSIPQFPHPAIFISPVDWLYSVLSWFNVNAFEVNTVPVPNSQRWTCEIGFSMPSRNQAPNVAPYVIPSEGVESATARNAQISAVTLCLDSLRQVSYHLPDFSYFKEQSLLFSGHTVAAISEWNASNNTSDLILEHDVTYASWGLMAILDQATEQLGYNWIWVDHDGKETASDKQFCIMFTHRDTTVSVDYIYGRALYVSHAARESAIIRALTYIDVERGYTIADINYPPWLYMYVSVNGQFNPPDNDSDSD